MRLSGPTLTQEEQEKLSRFSKWMLDVGEGKINATTQEGEDEPTWIQIPDELLLLPQGDKITCIVDKIYDDLNKNYMQLEYLKDCAILTPTNDIVDSINEYIVSLIPEETKEYLSCDKVIKAPNTHESYDLLYPVEFLNTLNGNSFPQHRIVLKKGTPIMLLRNLNQPEGLCNSTRLIVTSLGDKVIEGQIMTGTHKSKIVLIPRISLALKNTKWPFVLQRRQYPIKV
jgi:ATP-dependent DNA helicase PIF1